MAYIWGFSKAPDYLTGIYDPNYIEKSIASSLMAGIKVDSKHLIYLIETNRKFTKEKFYEWDVLSETIGVPLVNQKVLDILERECHGKFQAIPTILKLPNGEKIIDYYAINVINKVDLFSLAHSVKYNEHLNDDDIRGSIFETIAYKENVIEKEDLCKDLTITARTIFISERLREIFKKEKIKGPQFHTNIRDSVILV